MKPPDITAYGESALLLRCGEEDLPAASRLLLAWSETLKAGGLAKSCRAGYRELLVEFDPARVSAAGLADRIRALLGEAPPPPPSAPRLHEIPVRYGGKDGPDLPGLAARLGLDPAEVIHRHVAPLYTVAFLGFLPGFPYLLGLDPRLASPRLDTPRVRVPAGSVGIAGSQTGIYPQSSPGGWNLIGRSSVRLFDPAAAEPFVLRPGDTLRFVPVEVRV